MHKSTPGVPSALLIGGVLTLLVAVNPVSTASLAPGVPALRDYFGVSTSDANLVFSSYVFAFGLMQLVYGPLADRFGRRPVLMGAQSGYCMATLMQAFAHSFDTVLLGSAKQGASSTADPAHTRAVPAELTCADGTGKVRRVSK